MIGGDLLILKIFLVFMDFFKTISLKLIFGVNDLWTDATSYPIRGVALARSGELFVAFYQLFSVLNILYKSPI